MQFNNRSAALFSVSSLKYCNLNEKLRTLGSQLLNMCSYSKCRAVCRQWHGKRHWNLHRFHGVEPLICCLPENSSCNGRGSWVRCCMPARACQPPGHETTEGCSCCRPSCPARTTRLLWGGDNNLSVGIVGSTPRLAKLCLHLDCCVSSPWHASPTLLLFKKVVLMQSPCVCCANGLSTWLVPCTAFLSWFDQSRDILSVLCIHFGCGWFVHFLNWGRSPGLSPSAATACRVCVTVAGGGYLRAGGRVSADKQWQAAEASCGHAGWSSSRGFSTVWLGRSGRQEVADEDA
jgi:hypothetical protein